MAQRIMIIDDDRHICDALADRLRALGYEVVPFTDGCSALASLALESARSPVDLVLLDLNMPGMDGMTVLKELKSKHRGIPVIMMSATPSQESFKKAIEEGARDWIRKPMEAEVLTYKIAKLFGSDHPVDQ